MTDYVQTITNPGAESGMTGWSGDYSSVSSKSLSGGTTVLPHTGSKLFAPNSATSLSQDVTISGPTTSAIDHGQCTLTLKAWHQIATFGLGNSAGHLFVQFFTSGGVLLSEASLANTDTQPTGGWTQETLTGSVPSGARIIRIGGTSNTNHTAAGSCWDDFTLTVTDTGIPNLAAQAKESQVVAYALSSQPAAQVKASQEAVLAVAYGETSTGLPVQVRQMVAYALVRGIVDRRDLRCWRFPQDDHEFYVLQLGADGTLVYDMLTQQWAEWKSPTKNFWRGNDGCDWVAAGINVCCDTESGIIWQIDPSGRLDAGTTPITSQITGGLTKRFRTNTPCYMAELAVSEGQPPTGIDASTVGISLRTTDTLNVVDYGTVTGEAIGNRMTVRWYGLGLMSSPGIVFQITDTGYARRIDGLNIEVGNSGN